MVAFAQAAAVVDRCGVAQEPGQRILTTSPRGVVSTALMFCRQQVSDLCHAASSSSSAIEHVSRG